MAVAPGAVTPFSVRTPVASTGRMRPCAAVVGSVGGESFRSDGGGNKWWAPLLGWSGQPDYIDARPAEEEQRPSKPTAAKRRFGVLTEEKARQMRLRMMETESFHDAMYHSAIASRLASAVPDSKP